MPLLTPEWIAEEYSRVLKHLLTFCESLEEFQPQQNRIEIISIPKYKKHHNHENLDMKFDRFLNGNRIAITTDENFTQSWYLIQIVQEAMQRTIETIKSAQNKGDD